MFRVQNNVPYYYVNQSRDFQLFCRLFDVAFTSTKCNINDILNVTDSEECPDRLLEIIAPRIGFFDAQSVPTDALRMILKAFPYVMRHKGTITAVEECINLFLRYNKSQRTQYTIDASGGNISLTLDDKFGNEYILEILLSYVIPTGCYVSYEVANITQINTPINHTDTLIGVKIHNIENNAVAQADLTTTLSAYYVIAPDSSIQLYTSEWDYLQGEAVIESTKATIQTLGNTWVRATFLGKEYVLEEQPSTFMTRYLGYDNWGVRSLILEVDEENKTVTFIQEADSEDVLTDNLVEGSVGLSGVYDPTVYKTNSETIITIDASVDSFYQPYATSVTSGSDPDKFNYTIKLYTLAESKQLKEYNEGSFISVKSLSISGKTYEVNLSENSFVYKDLSKSSQYTLSIMYNDDKVVTETVKFQ